MSDEVTEETPKRGRPKKYKVKVDGVISDGKGGCMEVGEELDDKVFDVASLVAKGFAE